MARYMLRRLVQAAVVLVCVTFVVFFMMNVMGDPAALLLPPEATHEQIAAFRAALGLDDPLLVRYGRYLWQVLQGDFGVSLRHSEPALQLVLQRLPATIELAGAALLVAVVVGMPLGIIAATRRHTLWDPVIRLVALAGQSMPVFWLGIMLILFFGVQLQWFPVAGRQGLASLVLPALTLGMYSMASITRLLRSSLLEVLGTDYIRTARAKGLGEGKIAYKHALRNASLPVITVTALQFGVLMGGAVVTETVFAWPGIGSLAVQAISYRDLPVVEASVAVMAAVFVVLNLLVDVLYAVLDPRVRYS